MTPEIFQRRGVAFNVAAFAGKLRCNEPAHDFPLRVLGSMSVKRISSGLLAIAPISLATHFRNSSFSSGVGFLP